MPGFLGPSNNKKAAQYLNRTGSYSTHGQRSGYVEGNFGELPEDQLNNTLERIAALGKKKAKWQTIIAEVRRDLQLKSGVQLKKYEKGARLGILNNSKDDSQRLLEVLPICCSLTELEAEIKKLKGIMSGIGIKPLKDIMFDILKAEHADLFNEIKQRAHAARTKLIVDKQEVFQSLEKLG